MAGLVDFGAMLTQRPMLGLAVTWPGAGVLERVGEDWDGVWIDGQHGEWFGHLSRQGEVLMPLKGGKWKGCFHVPRGLFKCMTILGQAS